MKKVFTGTVFVFFCFQAEPAMAYLDPGTGSAVLSAILGAIAAIAFTIKTFWYKVKSMFSGKMDDQAPKSDQAQENEK